MASHNVTVYGGSMGLLYEMIVHPFISLTLSQALPSLFFHFSMFPFLETEKTIVV